MASKEELEAMGIDTDNNTNINISQERKTNTVAHIIKIIAIVVGTILCGFGIFTVLDDRGEISIIAIALIVGGFVSAVFIYALGEIIQLLENIKNK